MARSIPAIATSAGWTVFEATAILAGSGLLPLAENVMAAVDAGDLDGAERIPDEHTGLRLLDETLGWSWPDE